MKKYNPEIIEKKWQNYWAEKRIYKSKADKTKKKILCARNVSLSFWKDSHGTFKKLYNR